MEKGQEEKLKNWRLEMSRLKNLSIKTGGGQRKEWKGIIGKCDYENNIF